MSEYVKSIESNIINSGLLSEEFKQGFLAELATLRAKAEALDWIMCTYDANVLMGSTDETMRQDLVTAIITCKSKLPPARGEGTEQ